MKKGKRISILFALVLLLAVCAASAAAEAPAGASAVKVSTVDELIAAIAPDTTVTLAAGTYDLSTAATYGGDTGSPYTRWEPVYDGDRNESFELVITGADRLRLQGAGMDSVTVAAIPRYANVLHFVGCSGLSISRLTAGHTEEPGYCAGGVLWLENCTDADISFCGLFGCGTVGVQADRCTRVSVNASRIYDCSQYAVCVNACRDVRVVGCDITDNGDDDGSAFALFSAGSSDGFLVADCRIRGNATQLVLDSTFTKNTRFLSNLVESNLIMTSVFSLEQYAALADGCSFELNMFPDTVPFTWYLESGLCPVGADGNDLSPYALKTMCYSPYNPDTQPDAGAAAPLEVPEGFSPPSARTGRLSSIPGCSTSAPPRTTAFSAGSTISGGTGMTVPSLSSGTCRTSASAQQLMTRQPAPLPPFPAMPTFWPSWTAPASAYPV